MLQLRNILQLSNFSLLPFLVLFCDPIFSQLYWSMLPSCGSLEKYVATQMVGGSEFLFRSELKRDGVFQAREWESNCQHGGSGA